MELDSGILNLPKNVVQTSVVTGDRLALTKRVDPEAFRSLYQTEISTPGLNPAKAIYIGMTHTGAGMTALANLLQPKAQ